MLELTFGNEILSSYKRLSYTPWYALAEFIDNSTQSYFDNQLILDPINAAAGKPLTVKIEYSKEGGQFFINIRDNSIGMDSTDLKKALRIGKKNPNPHSRSKYGMGMKTSAFWLGNVWSIRTKKLNCPNEYFVEINLHEIEAGENDANIVQVDENATPIAEEFSNMNVSSTVNIASQEKVIENIEEHYTVVKITDLNRSFQGRTIPKIKDYLRSIYRLDFEKHNFHLYWNDELLTWDYNTQINSRLIKQGEEPLKKQIDIQIGDNHVTGWAGVFAQGSRNDAGFSIIQNDRIIVGWPGSFRPDKIFGYQEGGRNDLINQRLVGELFMNGFEVSHTKDAIFFEGNEEEELQDQLIEQIGDLIHLARTNRPTKADERKPLQQEFDEALANLSEELQKPEFRDVLQVEEVPPVEVVTMNASIVARQVKQKIAPQITVNINQLTVFVFINDENASPYEPYLITESRISLTEVSIIINKMHPHWKELKTTESIFNYIKHCVYDGVAEWKAYFKAATIDPDTIKLIKDSLLRIPFDL